VDGIDVKGYPSKVFLAISALSYDHAITIIFLAFFMVSIPIEMAHLGTFSYPPKLLAASFLVSLLR
jgi:hypothetical protein